MVARKEGVWYDNTLWDSDLDRKLEPVWSGIKGIQVAAKIGNEPGMETR
jgi:hypothetical protein